MRRDRLLRWLSSRVTGRRREEDVPSTIQDVKRRHEARLLALPGVVSVGVGRDPDGTPAIIVGLDGPRPETAAQIPPSLEDYPLSVQIVGPITAH